MNTSTVRIVGGLLPSDLLEQIVLGEAPGQKPEDFGLEKNRRLSDEIAAAWSDARAYWDAFGRALRRAKPDDPATTPTRDQWMLPLLRSLGYGDITFMPRAADVDGQTYALSHRAGKDENAPPLHIVGIGSEVERDKRLDRRSPTGRPRLSPHALVQEYLNRTEHLWGVVTNGARLRLLRDSSRITRPSYIEFDLEQMLVGEQFADFALCYRMLHRTRLPQRAEDTPHCLLETWYQQGVEQGGRVRENLRTGVEQALRVFGNGFLTHPANTCLRERLTCGSVTPDHYYRQLLLLIYRLLFLMVSEERGLIVPPATLNAVPSARGRDGASIYLDHYSVAHLRTLVETPGLSLDRHSDLWLGLQATFGLFTEDGIGLALDVSPLNGDLFNPQETPDLNQTRLTNRDLREAIRCLSQYEEKGIRRRVNYAALDVEELGSVYESLLDYRPLITLLDTNFPRFELVPGTQRKTTGSYYTRPELVQELINSALVPTIMERLTACRTQEEKEQTLLALKVCDPACGSGHFLLAASRRIGRELARIRSGEDEPTPEQFHLAVRDVIAHCIYGVDANPLAVDLCKLALWLEGHWNGKPLSFLNHRIRCGNSLIGVLDPVVFKQGIPTEAFEPVAGDDKQVASALKKRHRDEQKGQTTLELFAQVLQKRPIYAERQRELDTIANDTPADVKRKAMLYEQLRHGRSWVQDLYAANLWTAAFFLPLTDATDTTLPTASRFYDLLQADIAALNPAQEQLVERANLIAERNRFFHWCLEFPEVFEVGGFDVVSGNPPWERIKLQEEEHWLDIPYIAKAANKAERMRRIGEWRSGDTDKRARVEQFDAARHDAEAESKFVRASGRFPLTGVGDINTFALFAELAHLLVNVQGRAGIIVPTGIATDDTCKQFFSALNAQHALVSLYDFENRERLFPSVDIRTKFCLMTISGKTLNQTKFAFFCTNIRHLQDARRRFYLTPDDLALLNPNTRTCPISRTGYDVTLTRRIYEQVPALINETSGQNAWGAFYMRLVDLSDHSEYLRFPWQERNAHWDVPLYEAKLFWAYDHRYSTFADVSQRDCIGGQPREMIMAEKVDPAQVVSPRYFLPRELVQNLHAKYPSYTKPWLLVWRDVARATDERTIIATAIPRVAASRKCPSLGFVSSVPSAVLLGNLNSLVLDYVARQKVGGTSLSYFILKQLPVLPPSAYAPADIAFIAPRVLELVYTAEDMHLFAQDMGYEGVPFAWDEARRALLRAELDAYYGHLYGLNRDELRYILDPADVYGPDFPSETFRVLKEKEMRAYGEYRTRRLVLEAWDRLFAASS